MKYLQLRDIDIVNNAINFSTQDLHIIGNCDIYTTKPAGGDKKLYKHIEDTLESRHQSLVRLSASLTPPAAVQNTQSSGNQNAHNGATQNSTNTSRTPVMNLSRDSPFGSFNDLSARRTFAYLIATLNAAHPDYDFSRVLRPRDFKRERSLRAVMNSVDTALANLRPRRNQSQYLALPSSHSSMVAASNDIWSSRMWELLDQEMSLQTCERYSYAPDDDPLDDGEGSIWSMHYFFFSKHLKRVCYFHLRALSVLSHSPVYKQPVLRRGSSGVAVNEGAGKRAGYWLGDKATGVSYADDDEEMEEYYPESSDDEDVDRIRYTDLDDIRNDISAGYWGCDSTNDYPVRGPASVTDEIGASMDI